MNLRVLAGVAALVICVFCIAAQSDPAFIEDSKGDFIAHLGNASVKNLLTAHPKFESSGSPNLVRKNSEGMQITARRFSGEYSKKKDGTTNLDRLFAQTSVVADYNSDQARTYQIAQGLIPTDPAGVVTKLTSESALFNEESLDDKLTFVDPFLVTDRRPGKNKDGQTQTASRMSGRSGIFHFLAPENGGKAKLKTADVAGPVHYHQVQTVIDSKTGKPMTSEFDVVGDHLTANLSSPTGEIVLDGNVKWSYTSDNGYSGTCSRIIATTDADGDITDFDTVNATASATPIPKEKHP